LFKQHTQPDEGRYDQNPQHHQRDLDGTHPLAIPRTVRRHTGIADVGGNASWAGMTATPGKL
jgi:hypothetical protein